MKAKIFSCILTIFMLVCTISLVSCDLGAETDTDMTTALPKYNEDIQIVLPESIMVEHFTKEEDETYYTSPGFSLWMEVNGVFLEMDYFTLEGNKRIYDNLYFYKDDYFYMVTEDAKYLYAGLGDSTSSEYAEVEKQDGEDVQVNVKKSGIYKLIFDVDTLKFDMEYKAEIDTPVYYTMKNCSIYSIATEWIEMGVNPENEDEFYIENFSVDSGKIISFFNNLHISNYKVTLDDSCNEKYGSARKASITMNIGGTYNIYINKKTYVVRLELQNPDTASYSCVYYDGKDFIPLEPYEQSTPYIFRKRIEVEDKYQSVPDFHTKNYQTYTLDKGETDLLMGSNGNYYFKQVGTYDLIINLKTFEITAELLPE